MAVLSKDEAQRSLNSTVWWAQYIKHHNGAKPLRSAALNFAWYHHLLLNVASFVSVILTVTVLVSYSSLKENLPVFFCKILRKKSKHN
jgi:glucuronosyltransferase